MYFFKTYVQKYVRWIAGSWMSANMASVFGVITIALICVLLVLGFRFSHYNYLIPFIPFLIIMRIIFNALDGLLAREKGTASIMGEIVNEGLDVLGDVLCFSALWLATGSSMLSLLCLVNLIWLGEFISVLGKSFPGGRRRQESLLGGKSERMFFLGIFCLAVFFSPQLVIYTTEFMFLLSFFVLLTAVKRVVAIIKTSDHAAYTSVTEFGK